jgi:ABC-2 type transport system permease protein
MRHLIRQELIKTWYYTGFRVIMIIHFILFIAVVLIPSSLNITVPGFSTDYLFQFPNVWQYIPWVASWFNILLSLLVIILICNEYHFITFRQSVINGLSKTELFTAKGIVILCLALYSTALVFIFCLAFGFIFTDDLSTALIIENTRVVFVYLVQVTAYMAFAMFFAVLFRNMALSIVLFFVYRLIFEPVLRQIFPAEARLYFPMKIITNLTPTPEFISIFSGNQPETGGVDALGLREMGLITEELPLYLNTLLALGYTGLLLGGILLMLRKRNL